MKPIPVDGFVEAVRFRKLDDRALKPEFATEGSAGFDLAVLEDTFVPFGATVQARTGLVVAAPEHHMLMIVARSSTWGRWGLRLGNQVGIVDEDYCGDADELLLSLWNARKANGESQGTTVPAGTRVAQGIFVPVHTEVYFREHAVMGGGSRGGWGSSG